MDISGLSALSDYVTETAEKSSGLNTKDIQSKNYANATEDELMDACKDFEAYFLEQCFKEMWKTIPESDSESSLASTSSMVDYYKDEFIKDMAEQSTEQSSLGLAQTLYEQMKRNYDL